MTTNPELFAEAPGGAGSFASLLLSMLDESTQLCLRRCAVPPTFDEQTFVEALQPEGAPDLDALVSSAQLEPEPSEWGRFRISPTMRAAAFGSWWRSEGRSAAIELPIPARLAELAAELAARAREDCRELEELDLAVLCGPETAEAAFTRLADRAAQAHDLSGWRAVLDVLDSPLRCSLVSDRLRELRNQSATLLSAAGMWTTAYYESARYVRRPELEDVMEELLRGGKFRALQMYADGGMGKTMQLRWLIARRCATNHPPIPCARLDFDVIHPVTAARLPWLLLVEIAAQLDRQLAGAPFREYLASHGHYRMLLRRPSLAETPTVASLRSEHRDVADIKERFVGVLRELPGDRPVLLVLDTMEETIRPGMEPDGMLDLLKHLLESLPSVRLVLAGRYDLRTRVPRILQDLPGLRSVKVARLTPDEQRRYLTDVRGIRSESVVGEIVRLSEGLPFTLAMYANLVKESDRVNAGVLASFRSPGLFFAIERVLERIDDDQLQWVIRYGVVPRKLSFDFLRAVIAPHLPDSMAGRSALDDPTLDDRPKDRPREIFRTGIGAPVDDVALPRLWQRLLEYAEDYSWVSVASEARDVVVLRPDVVEPLRGVLRRHDIYLRLQRDAADYFERQSGDESGLRREAIYHRFQFDPGGAADAWHRAVQDAREAGREEACLELATDLLGPEYVDWTGEPVPGFPHQMLAEAQLERARAAAKLAGEREAGPDDPLWSDVEDGLRAASQLADTRSDVELPQSALLVLKAQLLIARGRVDEAEPLLREHRRYLTPSRELGDAERALGQAFKGTRPALAAEHLQASYAAATGAGDRSGARWSAVLLTQALAESDQYDRSLAAIRQARRDGTLAPKQDAAVEVFALLKCVRTGEAYRLAESIARVDPVGLLALAAAQGELGDPVSAIRTCSQLLRQLAENPNPSLDLTDTTLAVRGAAYGQLVAVARGTRDLLSAAARARELRQRDDAASYTAHAASLLMEGAGDLREARQCLEEALRGEPGELSSGWLDAEVVSAQLDRYIGSTSDATARLRRTVDVLTEEDGPPRHRVVALVALLAVCPPETRGDVLGELVTQLRRVCPPAARLALLEDMIHVGEIPPPLPAALDDLVAMAAEALVEDPDERRSSGDSGRLHGLHGEVLRVAGRRREAAEAFGRARTARGEEPLAWWWWLRAVERLGPVDPAEPVPPDDLLDSYGAYPLLVAAYRTSLADRRLDIDPPDVTLARLVPVEGFLAAKGRLTQWSAHLARTHARLQRRAGNEGVAHRHAAESVRMFSRLGDPVRRDQVVAEFELGTHATQEDSRTFEIRMVRAGDDVDVISGEGQQQRSVVRHSYQALIDPEGLTSSPGRWAAARETRDLMSWADHVGRLFLSPALGQRLQAPEPEGIEVCVVPRAPELAAVPWELARVPEHGDVPLTRVPGVALVYRSLPRAPRQEAKVRALQVALGRLGYFNGVPDGFVGPETVRALQRFQQDHGLTPDAVSGRATWAELRAALLAQREPRKLRVLVLRPNPDRELQYRRVTTRAVADIVNVYLRHGASVHVLEAPTIDRMLTYGPYLGKEELNVVHICAAVRSTGGSTVLDFGGDPAVRPVLKGREIREEIPVTALGELITAMAPDVMLPTVILDPPQPQTSGETIRALLARNSFAYQVLRLGRVPAVLATGLARPDDHWKLRDLLVSHLTAGETLAEVVTRLHRWPTDPTSNLRSALPFLGSALFLQHPPFTVLPLTSL